jgi:hypothetical protein
MRQIHEYINIVLDKYKEDHDITGISIKECVDIVVDAAFFKDEICYPIIDPLKERILSKIKEEKLQKDI